VKTLRALVVLLPLLAACEDDTSSGNPGAPGGPLDPTPSGETPPPVEPACEAPTKGPTLHKGDVGDDEVWHADASPHILEGNVTIRNGRTLTIEPCAEVLFGKGMTMQVAAPATPNKGSLVAQGTAKRPIRFAGRDGARWSNLHVQAPGTARLAYVTFENGGSDDFAQGSSIRAVGDGVDGADPLLQLDHVTVTGSLGTGVWMDRGATFIDGSRDLTISGAGSYPITIEEHALDALPTGVYKGNAIDEIFLDPRGGQTGGSGILADGTIHERGVPYHVGRSKGASLIIGGRPDGKLVTVTVEPGVVMRFVSGGAFKIQHFTNEKPSTATLRAIGTADKPIVFTSASATPKPGDWLGLWYGGIPDASNAVDHVRIENAGYDCGCILGTCSAISQHEGAIIFTAQPPRAFVTNTKFVDIAGHGITEGYSGSFIDFRATNEFNVSGCVQTRPSTASCPSPRPACD
jgi:hypothetical protein